MEISLDEEEKGNDLNSNIKCNFSRLYIVPIWKFILYNVLSFGVYHILYLNTVRGFLRKENKLSAPTILSIPFGFSIKLIHGVNDILRERNINKKMFPWGIALLYWILFALFILIANKMGISLALYISSFFLSLPLISLVYNNNKYLAIKKPRDVQGIVLGILGVLIGTFIFISNLSSHSVEKEGSSMNPEISIQNKWQDYQSESGIFSVKAPGKFSITSKNTDGMIVDAYSVYDENTKSSYRIDHIKIPEKILDLKDLELFAKGIKEQPQIKIEQDETINNTWYAEGIFSDNGINYKTKMMTKISGDNIFTITVVYKASLNQSIIQSFFDSFKILK